MNHKNGQDIHQSCKFRILLHKCIRVICVISVGIRQHKRSSSNFWFWISLKASPESSLFIWGLGGKRSSNCIYKWQALVCYKFFIPLVTFSAVSLQNSVCNIILSVIFPGPYCGIHMEARELHVKFWDPFQATKSMFVWGSVYFVSRSSV